MTLPSSPPMTSAQVQAESGLSFPFNMRDTRILNMAGDASLGPLHDTDLYGKSTPVEWSSGFFGPQLYDAYPGGFSHDIIRTIVGPTTPHLLRFVPVLNSSNYHYSGNESGNNYNPQAEIDVLKNGTQINYPGNSFPGPPPMVGWTNPNPRPGPAQWCWTGYASVIQGDQITLRVIGQAYNSTLDVTMNVYDDTENGYLLESFPVQISYS